MTDNPEPVDSSPVGGTQVEEPIITSAETTARASLGLMVGAVVAAAIALGSIVVAFVANRDTGNDQKPVAVPAPATTTTAASINTSITTTAPEPATTTLEEVTTVATTEPDPDAALGDLGASLNATSISRISTDECGTEFAMVVADGQARLVRWENTEWQDDSTMLGLDQLDPAIAAIDVQRVDVTMDGNYEFMVKFDPGPLGGRPFGGVFGPTGCSWNWVPIRDWDENQNFIDGLSFDDTGALLASGFAGSPGRKTVYVVYDSSIGAFATNPVDPSQYSTPVAPQPQQPPAQPQPQQATVVSTSCTVRSSLTSDTRGTLWSITIWNNWSDGRRTMAGARSIWSWSEPGC